MMSVAELWPKDAPAPAPPEAQTPVQAAAIPVELAIVIPTLNERDNVPLVVERLNRVLAGVAWEAIFVDDDSPDGTADTVRELALRQGNIRCIQRLGRRGLSSACIEGMLASAAPYVAVMDGDLQHDETLLPRMLEKIKAEHLDVVVASRYIAEGEIGDWERARVAISGFATRLSRVVVKAELSDPMSGFFIIERSAFTGAMRRLSGQGFKILLDLFASTPRPFAFAEVPLKFRERLHGESKLDTLVAWEYLMLLMQKLIGPAVPVRFLLFSVIGGLGLGVHLTTLWLVLHGAQASFAVAPEHRHAGRDDRQFSLEQPLHLSRPPTQGVAAALRPRLVLCGVRLGRGGKCRDRRLDRRLAFVVDGGSGRRGGLGGVGTM